MREHTGGEALEVYGPPVKLAEIEATARARGHPDAADRHVDHAAERQRRDAGGVEGERRPANLEDVFVLLTGEDLG